MAYILGIDTGGTYTDAVIYDNIGGSVLSKGKALTTRENLAAGIECCLGLLDQTYFEEISQVNLSTTLATNAIVENRGNKIALFLLGDRPEGELPAEELVTIMGKFDIRGRQICPLDEKEVRSAAERVKGKVGAVAVSGFASIRNNQHEILARDIIQTSTGLPVVCAHELSSQLGYYDRTVTAALNARLLSVIYDLLKAVKCVLRNFRMNLPLMVVTGSGSLISEQMALRRPVETVLSGPAASISGAMYLAGKENGLILDMGGTTTDIALAEKGKVRRSSQGADVGGYHLHVNAAEIYTFGVGGDSRIYIGAENKLMIGPNKIYPVCRAAMKWPEFFEEMKRIKSNIIRQKDRRNLLDGCMIYLRENNLGLDYVKQSLVDYLQDGPHTIYQIKEHLGDCLRLQDIAELEEKGIIMRIGITPTDILHAEGIFKLWSCEAAMFAVEDMAQIYGMCTEDFIVHCREIIENRLACCCKSSRNNQKVPIVGVGAPSGAWLPGMSELLKQKLCLPKHKEVANAVGAAVAFVSESGRALIRYNSVTGTYMLFLPDGRREFGTMEQAREYGIRHIKLFLGNKAGKSGCENARISITEECMGSEEDFIEYEIMAVAEGQPKWLIEKE